MKVKYLAIIEIAVLIIAFIPTLLCYLFYLPFYLVSRGFGWILDTLQYWKFKFGNWLLRHSYEVTHGVVRNKSLISSMTAIDVYLRLI